jgi:hypothetical protein
VTAAATATTGGPAVRFAGLCGKLLPRGLEAMCASDTAFAGGRRTGSCAG